ncbi:uncharacterized membrane protein HdeD (DUF308 family) [Saccharothrix tamanrassetensis]|uniref:Uncharacterized membrane protein HdeD (DUF308 family) n=1 Tax=Saccharothrix tamanrassetensis TaxID=1051531 RepID=A0A841CTD8_9PSEU|nr:hypothetical protein [Saccharothrix tamanrassetensis]MBB5959307.1 uncharacterized membrane protein HdeD (DUF308 family) [Saccharothrix tamanrassetensis]
MANLSWPQRAALVLGALLVVWALVDLVAGRTPLGVLHLISGVAVLAVSSRVRAIRHAGALFGLVYLVVFAYGMGDPGGPMDAGVLGNGAHLLLGFASVAIAESCVWCEQRAKGLHRRRAGRLP